MDLKKSRTRKRKLKAVVLGLIFILLAVGLLTLKNLRERKLENEKSNLPKATSITVVPTLTSSVSSQVINKPVPSELNLNVPFISQAPLLNWDQEHEEFCEEASVLMASKYFQQEELGKLEEIDNELHQIKNWQKENFGFFESTTIEETARIIEEELNLKSEVINNPNPDDIKSAIAQNKLVVVPASGRALENPFFKQPGPIYHMLLIKGYTADQFITNDPGTKRGENYPYNIDTIMEANHDWNGGDVPRGNKVMLIVYK